jgi:seryl-tRNA synthetase
VLDLKSIRQDPEPVKAALAKRGDAHAERIDRVLELDRQRRDLQAERDQLAAAQNKSSKEIGERQKAGEEAGEAIVALRQIKQDIKRFDERIGGIRKELDEELPWLPNLPHEQAPIGGEEANAVLRSWGEPRELPFKARPHWDVGSELGILSIEGAARLAGSGFALLCGAGARLERALISFMLDMHVDRHGYTEFWPPSLAQRDVLYGTGQLPKLESDMYCLEKDDLFLIPTAEVQLININRGQTLAERELPISYCAFSNCFRREAGAAGRDTRGLIRLHQFDKVELVKFVVPERSEEELEKLTADAEAVLQALELSYRVVALATGDLSFASSRTYDLELWAPGVERWLEVSSCSNCGDFQARRANIRYKPDGGGKPRFVHTLNGSGTALPRLVVAILENYQREDGSVDVPAALRPYIKTDLLAVEK